MEKIKNKLTVINNALKTLQDGINLYNEHEETNGSLKMVLALRDSIIQRFEYCTNLFWKVLKLYLEDVEKVTLTSLSPKGIIPNAVKTKTLSEKDGKISLAMIKSRNETSHIYHEETADNIAEKIPDYYSFIKTIIEKIKKNTMKK